MKTLAFISFLLISLVVAGAGPEYRMDYDYPDQGDDWYGKQGQKEPRLDYPEFTDITTQQGDDFCYGYEPTQVNFNQGPELARTQDSHTAYAFNFTGGTRCLFNEPEPPFDLIFADNFE